MNGLTERYAATVAGIAQTDCNCCAHLTDLRDRPIAKWPSSRHRCLLNNSQSQLWRASSSQGMRRQSNLNSAGLGRRHRSIVARSTDCCAGERSTSSAARSVDHTNRSNAHIITAQNQEIKLEALGDRKPPPLVSW